MNELLKEILPFGLALQIACYLLWAFNVFGGLIQYPLGDVTSINGVFDIGVYDVLLGIGGAAIIGVVSMMLRTGITAVYTMLLWAFSVAFKVVQTFVLAIPNTIGALIPAEINPNPDLFPVNPIGVAVAVIVGYGAFWWLFSLVLQRDT